MGGAAFPDVSPISIDRVDDTVASVGEHLNVPFSTLQEGYLGSTGKKNVSGDLDLGLQAGKFSRETVLEALKRALGDENVRILPHNVVSARVPQAGSSKKVQVDLMVGELPWLKFSYHSPAEGESDYKGLYRSQLLRAVAKSMRREDVDLDSGQIRALVGPRFDYQEGISTVRKGTRPKERGEGWTKTLEALSPAEFRELFPRLDFADLSIKNPTVAAEFLFGAGTHPSQLRSYELVSDLIARTKSPDQQDRILRAYREIIQDRLKLPLPREGWW
ncbi:hypothetical protein [Azospirillum sp. sgz301742]